MDQYCIVAYNKKQLYDLTPKEWGSRIIIAQDCYNQREDRVIKKYFWFKSHKYFIRCLKHLKEKKWFYEVFEDQQATCMYFDIEWYFDCGDFSTPEDIINEILTEYQLFIRTHYPAIEIPVDAWHLLKSSGDIQDSKVKYSYHLIDRSGYVLQTKNARSNLARSICYFLNQKASRLCELKNKEGNANLPIDLAVYTAWQNFRTIWSSKMNSDRKLLPVDLNGKELTTDLEAGLLYFAAYLLPDSKVLNVNEPINNAPKVSATAKIKHVCKSYESNADWKLVIKKNPERLLHLNNDGSTEFYLKCIPNAGVGQDWPIYFAIAASVQREGEPFEVFKLWAAQSSKFVEKDAVELWNSLLKSNRPYGYNGGTIRNMAKFCVPEVFGTRIVDFQTKLRIIEYESEYMRELPIDKDVIICQSPMGTGKTYGMAQLISKLRPARVLILSSRLTYTQNAIKDINVRLKECGIVFKSYEDRNNLDKLPYLVIQMESLHRLSDCASYDLLLIDECEACLKQFNSNTMLKIPDQIWGNLTTFSRLFHTSKTKVFLDAFVSNRTIDFVEKMIKSESSVVLVNKKMSVKRKAIQYTQETVWNAKLLDDIRRGKRIVVFLGSLKKGKELLQEVVKSFPHIKVKFYSSETSNQEVRSDLSNVRDSWRDLQLLMYTSKITVGVNFDEQEVFDAMYVKACTLGCTARDTIQATMRVRHLRENTLHYYIDYSNKKESVDVPLLEYRLQIKKDIINKIDKDLRQLLPCNDILRHNLNVQWRSEKKWMVHLYLQNALEIEESRISFRQKFKNFLEKCGYQHSYTEEIATKTLDKLVQVPYNEIPTLSPDGFEHLLNTEAKTSLENLMITKYIFTKKVKQNLSLEVLECCWKQYVSNRKRLTNLKSELACSSYGKYQRSKEDIQLRTYMPESALQIDPLRRLLEELKIVNTIDCKKVIKNATLESVWSNKLLLKDLDFVFELGKSTENLSKKQALGLINSALNSWCGSKLVKIEDSRKQGRKDGKKIDAYDYRLENKFEQELIKISKGSILSLYDVYLF